MIRARATLALLILFVRAMAQRWDTSMLQASPPVPMYGTIKYLMQHRKIEQLDWGCMFQTDKPGHSKNKWHAIDTNRSEKMQDPAFLRGTTYWVNEYMSVGHIMYDIAMLQVLQKTKVDRIVLQRAACIGAGQCLGIGVFDTFFRGMYIALIEAYQKDIPLFLRWSWQSKDMKPMYLSSTVPMDEVQMPPETRHPAFQLQSVTCMERVIRNPMRCTYCFHDSVGPEAAAQFKRSAYRLAPTPPLPHHFPPGPIVVTLAHRGLSASRHIANLPFVLQLLRPAFPSPTYSFRVIDTTNNTRPYAEQLRFVAQSQVVIAEHGAFQSNLIYLRNGSLLVDLRGDYKNGEIQNFKNLARMFGVFYADVATSGLSEHKGSEFNVTREECLAIIDTVRLYAAEKPYRFNVG